MKAKSRPLRSTPQRAIAAAVTSEIVRSAADLWGAENSAPRPIPAVQNFVFSIGRTGSPAVLRLTHESHRSLAEVESELCWMIDLKERGLPVAGAFRSVRNTLTEPIGSAHGRFVAVCFKCLPGVEANPAQPEFWSTRMREQLGSIMAQMHQAAAAAGWKPETLSRGTWRDESVARNFHSYVPASEKSVHRAFDRVRAELDSLPRSRESFGLIHADLNHANFLITPGGLNIFDFDDSCYSWFAYDLIVPIFHQPTADQTAMDAKARATLDLLLQGYERVRPFDRAWLEWLPLFLKWRDLLTYGFFYEQLEIGKLPAQLRKTFFGMRARIEADRPIADLSAAG